MDNEKSFKIFIQSFMNMSAEDVATLKLKHGDDPNMRALIGIAEAAQKKV